MILPVLILLTYLPSFKILAYAAYVGSIFLAIAMIVSQYLSVSIVCGVVIYICVCLYSCGYFAVSD